jgi:uncharacterized protein
VSWTLGVEQLADLARGAAILGTGGGGDPRIGRLLVAQGMRDQGPITVLAPEELADDAFVIPTAQMGAPTVMVEKIPRGTEPVAALRALERRLSRRADATMPIECGGINSTMPLVVGARTGLPVIDADGMGRAFPELQMETFHVYGVPGTPMAITNEHGDTTLVTSHDNKMMEWLARGITIRMGGSSLIAEYSMDGATARRTSVPGTIGLGIAVGRCLREARARHDDPFDALIEMLRGTLYGFARVVFEGKVVDVFRRTTEGFAKGNARIESTNGGGTLELRFQNEHLIALDDGRVRGIVPDLICVLEADTAEPITTEGIRYGQRVKVMVVSTPAMMRTPEALEVFGPRAFGLEYDFTPIEELA